MSNKFNKWPLFRISILVYLPAFILVLVCFGLFRYTNSPSQTVSLSDELSKEIRDQAKLEVEKQIKTSLRKEFEVQNRIIVEGAKANSTQLDILDKYISGEIYKQSKEESENAAKDEIEKLKADWKGDLFGQISFPVLFAIASIFAAFAVKDILTEVLKQQERVELQLALKEELKRLVPQAVKNSSIYYLLKETEYRTYFLEYKLLGIQANQLILEVENNQSAKLRQEASLAVGKLFVKADNSLQRVQNIAPEIASILRISREKVLSAQIRKIGGSLPYLENTPNNQHNNHPSEKSIFQVEVHLLLVKLMELQQSSTDPSQQTEIETLITNLKDFASRDISKAINDNTIEMQNEQDNITHERPTPMDG